MISVPVGRMGTGSSELEAYEMYPNGFTYDSVQSSPSVGYTLGGVPTAGLCRRT